MTGYIVLMMIIFGLTLKVCVSAYKIRLYEKKLIRNGHNIDDIKDITLWQLIKSD